jgi:D-serine deaminase-like pyridoxal phosphate-dependent protein
MDSAYTSQLDQPFKQALFLRSTVISKSKDFVVCDAGLKAQGMDHGNPTYLDGEIMFCSDEHTNIIPNTPLKVGDQISLVPAHVDPTMAKHEILNLVRGGKIVDQWNIDLRHW